MVVDLQTKAVSVGMMNKEKSIKEFIDSIKEDSINYENNYKNNYCIII